MPEMPENDRKSVIFIDFLGFSGDLSGPGWGLRPHLSIDGSARMSHPGPLKLVEKVTKMTDFRHFLDISGPTSEKIGTYSRCSVAKVLRDLKMAKNRGF